MNDEERKVRIWHDFGLGVNDEREESGNLIVLPWERLEERGVVWVEDGVFTICKWRRVGANVLANRYGGRKLLLVVAIAMEALWPIDGVVKQGKGSCKDFFYIVCDSYTRWLNV